MMKTADSIKKAEEIALKVKNAGGTAYFVGGFVRDRLMKRETSDIDIEVHRIRPDALRELLSSSGQVLSYGESFGIFSLKGYNIDIALPRKEKACGRGHRDFEISADPFLGEERAAGRRDFTVNALMQDILTSEVLDFYGGLADMENKILRCVNEAAFSDDPLRVFRLAQFSSRFGFEADEKTLELCRKASVSALSRERVFEELKKALLKGERPSVFFRVLERASALDFWFPEVKNLSGLPQNPVYHPEGDVFEHTMAVLDTGKGYLDRVSFPSGFMLLCLCHDFGKAVTTREKNGRIISYNHENEGVPIAEKFLSRLTDEKKLHEYVANMIRLHMKPNMYIADKSGVRATNRMFDEACSPADLIYFSSCDRMKEMKDNEAFLFGRLEIYNEIMSRPFVEGSDLIKAGLKPDESFSLLLDYAHKLRLSGAEKKEALRETLLYSKKLKGT